MSELGFSNRILSRWAALSIAAASVAACALLLVPDRSSAEVSIAQNITQNTDDEWKNQSAYLRASDPSSRINIRSSPSVASSAPHYGFPGDRVTVLDRSTTTNDGYVWYRVRFVESGAEGWVRGDLIAIDYAGCHFRVELGGFACD